MLLGKEAYAGQTAPPHFPRFSTSATTLASFSTPLIPSSPYKRHRSILVYDHHFRPGMMLYSVDYIFHPGDRLIRAFRGRLQLKRLSLVRSLSWNPAELARRP